MTTEEKAKAYDEALEKAKKYHEEYWQVDAKDITETLFPQLRESEDEKIRKEIIDFLETIPASELKRIPRPISEWFSYLAKQKEQKPAEWSEGDEKMIDTIISVLGQYIDYKSESGTGSGYATPRYSKEIAWLEFLRPSWKPSEE